MPVSNKKTPIIVFAYNRPKHLDRLLESLSRCDRLRECRLYLHCDGAKRAEDKGGVAASRRVAFSWAEKLGGMVIERDRNQGLSQSVVEGVKDLCEKYGRAIVLEDDLVVRKDFIDFMLRALDQYANRSDVLQISGYQYGIPTASSRDVYFLPLTSGWGWATWKRAWDLYEWEPKGAREKLECRGVRRRFSLWDSYPYPTLLEERLRGNNESWGILWQWTVFERNAHVVFPSRSLVWNGGFDGSGTHAGLGGVEVSSPRDLLSPAFDHVVEFPEVPIRDENVVRQISVFLRRQMGFPHPTLKEKVVDLGWDVIERLKNWG